MSEYPVESIRSDYHALRDVCYLNTGTIGIMSETVLGQHLDRIAQYERFGHAREADARSGYEDARHAIARLINASPGEVALNRNATDGINYVLSSYQFSNGSTLLTTSEEHPAVMLPITLAARRCDGRVLTLGLDVPDEELIANLKRLLETSPVSFAVLSHVSCETGRRLPISELSRVCRDYGVPTLVDGAQSVGQFQVDIREIDCEFMTGNGHKWLCGPKGTGFLYIKHDRLGDLTPPYVGAGATDPPFDRHQFPPHVTDSTWRFRDDAERFEFGTRNWHLYGATADAVSALQSIGSQAIERHVADLTDYLKSALGERRGVSIHTPEDWNRSCGLVTFSLDGWDGTDLSARLWEEFAIIQRRVQEPNGVRISCAHYTSHEDLTRFLGALDAVTSA